MNTKQYKNELMEMKQISAYAGASADYTQGGGGNTSVKLDDCIMAIKASGYALKEITEEKGYVTVDYQNIKRYFDEVDLTEQKDYEKESLAVNLASIKLLDGMENKRPSVEIGFHSVLPKYVIHTHSVYANILCCSEEGKEKAKQIFADTDLGYIFIPYINPGFHLTLCVKEEIQKYQKEHGKKLDAIFMESHGVIVSGDDCQKTIDTHQKVNDLIRDYFGFGNFEAPQIEKTENGYRSKTTYVQEFIQEYHANGDYFDTTTLFPDQLVYLGGNMGKTILIDEQTGKVSYKAEQKQAQTIEEVMMSVAFVISEIQKAGLTLKQLDQTGVDFIKNWESEKYRAKLMK